MYSNLQKRKNVNYNYGNTTQPKKSKVETFSFSDIGDAFSFVNTNLGTIGDQFVNTVSNVYDPISGTLSGTFDKVTSSATDVANAAISLAGTAAQQFGSSLAPEVFCLLCK